MLVHHEKYEVHNIPIDLSCVKVFFSLVIIYLIENPYVSYLFFDSHILVFRYQFSFSVGFRIWNPVDHKFLISINYDDFTPTMLIFFSLFCHIAP
jgi:hypothetical protein